MENPSMGLESMSCFRNVYQAIGTVTSPFKVVIH
jgi:hypothetical protein